jgi:hypothetical protein
VSTALATETRASFGIGESRRPFEQSAGRLFEPSGSTLEDSILGAWEDLAARGHAECPVCAGELGAAGCETCGAELS